MLVVIYNRQYVPMCHLNKSEHGRNQEENQKHIVNHHQHHQPQLLPYSILHTVNRVRIAKRARTTPLKPDIKVSTTKQPTQRIQTLNPHLPAPNQGHRINLTASKMVQPRMVKPNPLHASPSPRHINHPHRRPGLTRARAALKSR